MGIHSACLAGYKKNNIQVLSAYTSLVMVLSLDTNKKRLFIFYPQRYSMKDLYQHLGIFWRLVTVRSTPDAVGGSLKRTANRLVRYGKDIMSAEMFKAEFQNTNSDIDIYIVHTDVVNAAENKLDVIKKVIKNSS